MSWRHTQKLERSQVKAVLGGRVRLFASGAAPLSAELHGFLRHVFGCPVLQ
ncbi:hypothetical protein T484DRAFT_1805519, partial [Baffinella frigidus]